jgi:hypothetical protein
VALQKKEKEMNLILLAYLMFAATTYSVPLDVWKACDDTCRQNTIKSMMQNFHEENPDCIRGNMGFSEDGKTFDIIIECTENKVGI